MPVLIQVTGVAAFLYVSRGETTSTFAAIFLSLIWLKVSEDRSVQEFGEKRAARYLYGKLGEWLDHNDAEEIFDAAQSKYLLFDGSIEADEYKAVVTAAGIANNLRGTAYVLVSVYLIFILFTVFTGT